MFKNLHFRKWFSKINPRKFAIKMEKEIEQDFHNATKDSLDRNELQRAQTDRDYNLQYTWETFEIYLSDKIIHKSYKYDIPLPSPRPQSNTEEEVGTEWSYAGTYYQYYLNDCGRFELKKKIKEEQKWVKDKISFYVSIIFGVLGLIVGVLSQI